MLNKWVQKQFVNAAYGIALSLAVLLFILWAFNYAIQISGKHLEISVFVISSLPILLYCTGRFYFYHTIIPLRRISLDEVNKRDYSERNLAIAKRLMDNISVFAYAATLFYGAAIIAALVVVPGTTANLIGDSSSIVQKVIITMGISANIVMAIRFAPAYFRDSIKSAKIVVREAGYWV